MMSKLKGCYVGQCAGCTPQRGFADVVLISPPHPVWTDENSVESPISVEHMRFEMSGDGCWTSCELLNNDQITPSGTYYLVTTFIGGKRCERWSVRLTASSSGTVMVQDLGTSLADGDTTV